MLLFLLTASILVHRSVSANVQGELTGWYEPPNVRGTWDLILSCVLTLTICVWSALHLNVPCENSELKDRNKRRARWILLGIFAPELVVSTAFAQYLTASWLWREIRKDVKHRKENVRAETELNVDVGTNRYRGPIRAGVPINNFENGP
jgi:hypothetical protein